LGQQQDDQTSDRGSFLPHRSGGLPEHDEPSVLLGSLLLFLLVLVHLLEAQGAYIDRLDLAFIGPQGAILVEFGVLLDNHAGISMTKAKIPGSSWAETATARGIESVRVRSQMTCRMRRSLCVVRIGFLPTGVTGGSFLGDCEQEKLGYWDFLVCADHQDEP
jgi:hypothetical protein